MTRGPCCGPRSTKINTLDARNLVERFVECGHVVHVVIEHDGDVDGIPYADVAGRRQERLGPLSVREGDWQDRGTELHEEVVDRGGQVQPLG